MRLLLQYLRSQVSTLGEAILRREHEAKPKEVVHRTVFPALSEQQRALQATVDKLVCPAAPCSIRNVAGYGLVLQ